MEHKSMTVMNTVLLLCFSLVGFCGGFHDPPSGDPSASQEAGGVPMSQLRMLSLGLAHLLQGVQENGKRLDEQGEQVVVEVDAATKNLESLRKSSFQAGRTHRQLRKDLQILSARGDRSWRSVKDLQKGLEDLETEQGATQQRMNRILQRLRSLSEPSLRPQAPLDVDFMKVLIEKRGRQLASLTSEVSARDRLIDRQVQFIDHLEKQACSL
ncbi:uncharacterized protein V6R79_011508 [Siganus canaliculatus]